MIGIGTPSSQRRIPRPIVTSMLSTVVSHNTMSQKPPSHHKSEQLVRVIHWPAQTERCFRHRLVRVDGHKLNSDKDQIVFVAFPNDHAVMSMMLVRYKYTRGCEAPLYPGRMGRCQSPRSG